jgi:hypothetical protein
MTPSKLILLFAPVGMMIAVCIGLKGSEAWLAHFGNSVETHIAVVGVVANALQAVGGTASNPAGGSVAHAR